MNEAAGQDKLVTCVDCGAQFTFSARDQAFYQERGYQAPRRCRTCRDKRKSGGPGGGGTPLTGGATGARPTAHGNFHPPEPAVPPGQNQFKVTCTGCGQETTVPFKPDPNRPVYCRTCYLNRKKS